MSGNHQKWNQRLAEAIVAQTFCPDDRRAAASWATCKVGEIYRAKTPGVKMHRFVSVLDPDGLQPLGPTDSVLHCLGMEFANAVGKNDVLRAARVAEKIEHRAMVLEIQEMQRQVVEETKAVVQCAESAKS